MKILIIATGEVKDINYIFAKRLIQSGVAKQADIISESVVVPPIEEVVEEVVTIEQKQVIETIINPPKPKGRQKGIKNKPKAVKRK